MVDNLIRLFDSEETEFNTLGLGVLSDAESCEVTEERNDEFELEMTYPLSGRHYKDIGLRKIIVAKSNPYSSPQPFRIYSISKPIDGVVTINAEHISYDLSGYPVSAFTLSSESTTIQNVFDEIKSQSVRECPFTFWTNKIATGKFSLETPRSIRSLLAGSEGSVIDVYGTAEYEFDGYSVKLWMSRGEDKGVSIRYGKNLTDIEQEENCASVYTAVYPYWYSETDDVLVTLNEADVEDSSQTDDDGNNTVVHIPDKIVSVDGTFSFEHILTLDLSDKFTEKPSELELYKQAKQYIEDNDIGVPKVSIEVSFETLSKTSDYEDYAPLEDIRLCDTVYVEFSELGVSATAKCVKTVYDVLTDKYEKVELGSIKNNLANSLSEQSKTLSNATSKSYVDNLIDDAVSAISGNSGGYVVIRNSKGGKNPDELLIMDTDDIDTATKVWRWNMSGLCYSASGYKGYSSSSDGNGNGVAITQDGKIVADFIAGNKIQGVAFGSAPDDDGNIWFSVTKDGYLTARAGEIGGCEIVDGALQIASANIEETLTGKIIEASEFRSAPDDDGNIWFSVTKDGYLTARAGEIGGLVIGEEELSSNDNSLSSKILRAEDCDNNTIFEIRTSEGENASSISILNLDCTEGTFSKSISTSSLLAGSVKITGKSLYINDEQVILLEYTQSNSSVTATISNSWSSNNITITITDSSGSAYNLKNSRTFYFKLHYTWGGWSDTKNITISAGSSTATQTFSGAFWGYDDAYFTASGSKTYPFKDGGTKYIDFRRSIEPYSNNTYDLGSDTYRWRQIYTNAEAISTSDRNSKSNIASIDKTYEALFDKLKPVSYVFKENDSGRTHIGFVAQDIKESMDELGISSKNFAPYCEGGTDENKTYGLRYGEFVALNTHEIQKLKERVKRIENLIGENS